MLNGSTTPAEAAAPPDDLIQWTGADEARRAHGASNSATNGANGAAGAGLADEIAYRADDESPVTNAQLGQQFWADWIADTKRLRQRLLAGGYRPIAVWGWDAAHLPQRSRGKAPVGKDWQIRALQDPPAGLTPSRDALNTGIWAASLRGVDVDVPDPDMAERVVALAVRQLGPTIRRTRANSGKTTLVYRAAEGAPRKVTLTGALVRPDDPDCTERNRIEVLGDGNQFVVDGIHNEGVPLLWPHGAPWDVQRDALPAVTEDQVIAFLEQCRPLIGAAADAPITGLERIGHAHALRPTAKSPAPGIAERAISMASNGHHDDAVWPISDIAAALAAIPNEQRDWDRWFRIAAAVFKAGGGREAAYTPGSPGRLAIFATTTGRAGSNGGICKTNRRTRLRPPR